jgi:hypothetical protein
MAAQAAGGEVMLEILYEIVTMYRTGHSDGYTHTHNGPMYSTFAAAHEAGRIEHGNYAVDPRPYECIKLPDGRVYIVEGPVKTADEVELDKLVRARALAKLTAEEIKLLGIKQ